MANLKQLRDKYKYIVLWGKYLKSYDYYIDMQVELAEKDGAPENAIFKNHAGEWKTFDTVTNPVTLKWFHNAEKGKK